MLKIGKGLKKKKKSKKKHKEAELFTEEELERYKKEHAQQKQAEEEEGTSKNSEEFEKFNQLTAGVDDILKRTQGDLDRIKKESFFQRKPTPSELQKLEDDKRREEEELRRRQEEEEAERTKNTLKVEEVEDSESEYEFDDGDDIFDTDYVDVLASGDLKLVYVPDDDEVDDGPDPFDTTTADEVLKKVEEKEKQKKKEISLGLAVNVLTGRAERDKTLLGDSAGAQPETHKARARPRKIQDFSLLGSFEEKEGSAAVVSVTPTVDAPKSLLDDDVNVDVELPEGETLIQEVLVKHLVEKKEQTLDETDAKDSLKDLVDQFDIIHEERVSDDVKKAEEVEDEFDEFTALAESSIVNQKLEEELSKFVEVEDDPFDTSAANIVLENETANPDPFGAIEDHISSETNLQAFNKEDQKTWSAFDDQQEQEVDPFDTSFVARVEPGKAELKLIEKEILGAVQLTKVKNEIYNEARILSRSDSADIEFNPRDGELHASVTPQLIQQRVSIHITDPSGLIEIQRASQSSDPGVVPLTLQHRDLLGGSNTDLASIGQDPIAPKSDSPTAEDYSDPFDTSIVDQVAIPGKAELAFLEKELLSDLPQVSIDVLKDDDFDPREEEKRGKQVQFDVPSPLGIDLDSEKGEGIRPLTPFYADPTSASSEHSDIEDPFDTSHVTSLPGKVELKLLEKELDSVQVSSVQVGTVQEKLGIKKEELISGGIPHSLSDPDFDPRNDLSNNLEVSVTNPRRHSDIGGVNPPTQLNFKPIVEKPDLFAVEEELPGKALTPAVEEDINSYIDPFDTTIAENIAPGKAELKLLESELITEQIEGGIKRSYTDPDFNPRSEPESNSVTSEVIKDILSESGAISAGARPLTPVDLEAVEQEVDDIDPFDTSIALNILPGKAELRLLESELIGQ